MAHWHAEAGPTGCYLPDSNEIYRTEEEARDVIRWEADHADDVYDHKGGSVEEGRIFYGWEHNDYAHYSIGIYECTCDEGEQELAEREQEDE